MSSNSTPRSQATSTHDAGRVLPPTVAGTVAPFDLERFYSWRAAQRTYLELKACEPHPQRCVSEAKTAWRQRLSRRPMSDGAHVASKEDGSGAAAAVFLRACALAQLCRFAAEEVLPAPSSFLQHHGLLPPKPAGTTKDTSGELERLFPLMALCSWLSRLVREAAETVPVALQAHRASGITLSDLRKTAASSSSNQRFCAQTDHPRVAPLEALERGPHPLALLRHLPDRAAVDSVVLAARRAERLETELGLASHYGMLLLREVGSFLKDVEVATPWGTAVTPRVTEVLRGLRVAAHLCDDSRRLASFWPALAV